ncbi:MAG: DHH family phosphoesterase [bacterium]
MSGIPSDIAPIVQKIKGCSSCVIVSHENPDGDSLGAQIGLALGLKKLGIKNQIRCKDPVPSIYDFLPGTELLIPSRSVRIGQGDILVVLDCGNLERTGISFIPHPPPMVINIDHHVSNTGFGHINWVDRGASATSEMVFHLLQCLAVAIDPFIATNLYTGILTDTGSFEYSNTTAQCLDIASQLVRAKADPHAISSAVYDRKSLPAIRLMGHVLSDMEIHHDQSVALLTVTRQLLEDLNATYEDTEELVVIPQQIESIRISILIKELDDEEFKVSLRSKGRLDVSQIAERLGGGGHPNAAGIKMKGSLHYVRKEILTITRALLSLSTEIPA